MFMLDFFIIFCLYLLFCAALCALCCVYCVIRFPICAISALPPLPLPPPCSHYLTSVDVTLSDVNTRTVLSRNAFADQLSLLRIGAAAGTSSSSVQVTEELLVNSDKDAYFVSAFLDDTENM